MIFKWSFKGFSLREDQQQIMNNIKRERSLLGAVGFIIGIVFGKKVAIRIGKIHVLFHN